MNYALQINKLSVQIGEVKILDSINFNLEEGSFLSIIGPNGAGKTTLLKSILGLILPTSGSVKILGASSNTLKSGIIAYVPQAKMMDRSFPALAIELVASGLKRKWPAIIKPEDLKTASLMLEKMGAANLANRAINKLSGGELQRVYLAKSLISKPRMVILDEPATGIDAVGEADLYSTLKQYQQESGATILMITHDLNAVCNLGSHVLVLNQKQIGFGTASDSLSEENLRLAFGHVGHDHSMLLGVHHD